VTETITVDQAWGCIRRARETGWQAGRSFAHETSGISIDPGGNWQSTHPAEPDAASLLDLLAPLVAVDGPLVIGQLGQSLDGRIATRTGHSHYINGLESRTHLHRLRALVDGVLIGAGTARDDDPQLTVRHASGPNPVRVLVDPNGRVSDQARMFTDGQGPVIHLVGEQAGVQTDMQADKSRRASQQVRRRVVETSGGFMQPSDILSCLAGEGIERVLVEGGGKTVSRFLQAGCLDRLHLMIAPLIIGSGPTGVSLDPIEHLDQALRPSARVFSCGPDWLFDLIPG